MTFDEYGIAMKTTKVYPQIESIVYPALALAEEVGETLGVLAKHLRDSPTVVDGESGRQYLSAADYPSMSEEERDLILNELGDVLWEWAALCTDLGFSLERVAQRNLVKLSDRKARGVLHGRGSER